MQVAIFDAVSARIKSNHPIAIVQMQQFITMGELFLQIQIPKRDSTGANLYWSTSAGVLRNQILHFKQRK